MFVFAHRHTHEILGTSGLVTIPGQEGSRLAPVEEGAALANAARTFGLAREDLLCLRLDDLEQAERINALPPAALKARLAEGRLAGVEPDPDYAPPEAALTPEDHLREVKEMVCRNLLASEHDRRWLAQKEAAKREGVPWLKSHPSATQAEFEAAMSAALAAEFPGEPIVVAPAGVIASYARGAHARGLVASSGFEALRDLVASTPEKQLQRLLAQI